MLRLPAASPNMALLLGGTGSSRHLPAFRRWPLDHVFFSEHFHLVEVAVLDDRGSDHLPSFVQLTCMGQASGKKPEADGESLREAEQTIEEGKRQGSNDD